MNKITLQEIKIILEKSNNINDYLELNFMPQEEARAFLTSIKNIDKFLIKLDSQVIDKDSFKKWSSIYLAIHNYLHSEIEKFPDINQDILKLEVYATAPIFSLTKDILNENDFKKLNLTYFLLGISALNINHKLENLISEKLILGEFISLGGIEQGIWGLKIKTEFLPEAALSILNKTEHDRCNFLIKKYKDLIFDFL
jgi:hypothetical protein